MKITRNNSPSVLMILENDFIPQDTRVWQEAQSLKKKGFRISIIAPAKKNQLKKEILEGITVYRYKLTESSGSAAGFVKEYAAAFFHTFRLFIKLNICGNYQFLHLHNPPEIFFPLAAIYRILGRRCVFDVHDLSPELYLSRKKEKDLFYRLLLFCEKMTAKFSNAVLATNNSVKNRLITRYPDIADKTSVVRNAPDLLRIKPVPPDAELLRKGKFIIGYIGEMNVQDGVNFLLEAMRILIHNKGIPAYGVLIGNGSDIPGLQKTAQELQIADNIRFTGYLTAEEFLPLLSAASVCVCPDAPTPLNVHATFVKIMEYMALSKPVVCFDLPENRVTAGDSGFYAVPVINGKDISVTESAGALADKLEYLYLNPSIARDKGGAGKLRIENQFNWEISERNLVSAYNKMKGL